MSNPVTIHSLWVYPVKSFRGIALERAELTSKGIKHDREWMVVKPNGRMLTQRQAPQMANIATALSESYLTLTHTQKQNDAIKVPLNLPLHANKIAVKVHKDQCIGIEVEPSINEWVTRALDWPVPLRLVKFDAGQARHTKQPDRFGDNATYFADAAPYLVANLSSISAINRQLSQNPKAYLATIAHFRPNIVLEGLKPFTEHKVSSISLTPDNHTNTHSLKFIDHCQRCVMITVDPDKGEFTHNMTVFTEIAKTNAMPDSAKAPAFGVNAVLDGAGSTWLTLGSTHLVI